MQRFHFHVHDGGRLISDREGLMLQSPDNARLHAIKLSAEMLADRGCDCWEGTERQITVTDETGETRFTLNFLAQAI